MSLSLGPSHTLTLSFLHPAATPRGCDSPPSPIPHQPLPKGKKKKKNAPTMVFSSVPIFLDPPNWNQQPSHPSGGGEALQLPPEGNMAAAATARPGSMADRARLGKVPAPEAGLNCPRCDSTNTKFCYFNNYSLSQPRHFCKTCRRYWTRGGTLRNVPVGGGCRRNKRSKGGSSSSSKPPASVDHHPVSSAITATITPPPLQQLPFMAPLHPLATGFGAAASNAGLNFPLPGLCIDSEELSGTHRDHWRLHQVPPFPLSPGLEPPLPPSMGLFPFDGSVGSFQGAPLHGEPSPSGFITELASVKMEERRQGLNLPRQYLVNDQYWDRRGGDSDGGTLGGGNGVHGTGTGTGGGWADLSGFNSSSTSDIL